MFDRLTRLKELLLEDRAALLKGDFAQLEATTAAVDGFLTELEASPELLISDAEPLLNEVRDLARRNASLLSASMEGTKAAKEKVEMIRRATSELNTYTSEGRVENVTPRPGRIEKRA